MESLINVCLHLAAALKPSASPTEQTFSKAVWDHLYNEGLSLRLQAAVLAKPLIESQFDWKSALFEALSQDSLSKEKEFKFEFIRGLDDCIKQGTDYSTTAQEAYLSVIEQRPDDLNIILWYTLVSTGREKSLTENVDLALPLVRISVIVDCKFL